MANATKYRGLKSLYAGTPKGLRIHIQRFVARLQRQGLGAKLVIPEAPQPQNQAAR